VRVSEGQVLWLNVTNAILGLLVLVPVLALVAAILVELHRRRRLLSRRSHHIDWRHLIHLGHHG
jgi:phosphate/sulfate permease